MDATFYQTKIAPTMRRVLDDERGGRMTRDEAIQNIYKFFEDNEEEYIKQMRASARRQKKAERKDEVEE